MDISAQPERIVVNLPSWVGDAVMATPTLRAVRETYPAARITYLMRPYVADIFDGSPWHDDVILYGGRGADGKKPSLWSVVKTLRAAKFDWGVLLPNSFRTALVMRLGKVKRRIGYDRDGRSLLLTDRLVAFRENGEFLPQPLVRYYLGIAQYLGCRNVDPRPQMFLTPTEKASAREALTKRGVDPDKPYTVLNPGAAFGSSKMWSPANFAQVSDELVKRGRQVAVVCGPNETAIATAIHDAQKDRKGVANMRDEAMTLGKLKGIIAGSSMLVTNDSGPRHFAIAYDIPVVTLFGPTDPAWTECLHPREIQVRVRVHCAPCGLRTCPIDHRCMTRLTPAQVLSAIDILETGGVRAAV